RSPSILISSRSRSPREYCGWIPFTAIPPRRRDIGPLARVAGPSQEQLRAALEVVTHETGERSSMSRAFLDHAGPDRGVTAASGRWPWRDGAQKNSRTCRKLLRSSVLETQPAKGTCDEQADLRQPSGKRSCWRHQFLSGNRRNQE